MPRPMRHERGFTLTEVLVTIGILGIIASVFIPQLANQFRVSLNSATRELASTIKEAYSSTVMTGKINRLAYDLKSSEYWVEVGPPTALLDTPESIKKDESRTRWLDKKPQGPSFGINKLVTRKKLKLPRGVSFADVQTQQNNEPITEGTAYTHFFPHGIVERTIIHLNDSADHKISLVITPVLGKTELYERYVTAKEVFDSK